MLYINYCRLFYTMQMFPLFLFLFVHFFAIFELAVSSAAELSEWVLSTAEEPNFGNICENEFDKLKQILIKLPNGNSSRMHSLFGRRIELPLSRAIACCKQLNSGTDQFGIDANEENLESKLMPKFRQLIATIQRGFGTLVTEIMLEDIGTRNWVTAGQAKELKDQLRELYNFVADKKNHSLCFIGPIKNAQIKVRAFLQENGTKEKQQMQVEETADKQIQQISNVLIIEAKLSIFQNELTRCKFDMENPLADRLILLAFFWDFHIEWNKIKRDIIFNKSIDDKEKFREKLKNVAQNAMDLAPKMKQMFGDHLSELLIGTNKALALLRAEFGTFEENPKPFIPKKPKIIVNKIGELFIEKYRKNKKRIVSQIIQICDNVLMALRPIGMTKRVDIEAKVKRIYAAVKQMKIGGQIKVFEQLDQLLHTIETETEEFLNDFLNDMKQLVNDGIDQNCEMSSNDGIEMNEITCGIQ